ncbi:hypothetical protein TRAPUB_14208 [Trametes pubescens]|uniref:Uncharacterized protein n=1 Tax=Trametes pubescens TaxID=154538 RepID=A0A1M2VP13_TRAPU|nr:hypothetical protein TRAPUB_14208 [Trametes pubescens]
MFQNCRHPLGSIRKLEKHNTQFKHSDFLIYTYDISMDSERPQDTQTSALITALLDHAKLAARIAWELNKTDGNIDQAGFERVRRDLGGSCAVFEGALVNSLAEFCPLSSPSSAQDDSQNTHLPSTMQNTLELNLCLTQLPQLRESLVADLPALLLGDLENALMPHLLAKLQPALLDVLQPTLLDALRLPAHTPDEHGYSTLGRYSRPTTNQRPATDTTTHALRTRPATDATTRMPRMRFKESLVDDRRYVDDPLLQLSGFVWDGSLPRDSDTSSHGTSSMQARRTSEGMGMDMELERCRGEDTRGKHRRSDI